MGDLYQFMPDLTPEEYEALKSDIAANGVQVAVIVDEHGNIIDGHHRARAAHEVGEEYEVDAVVGLSDEAKRDMAFRLNSNRRHLDRESKRRLIRASLKADPGLSDRQHAERTGSHHTTISNERSRMVATGEISQFSHSVGADGAERVRPIPRSAPESIPSPKDEVPEPAPERHLPAEQDRADAAVDEIEQQVKTKPAHVMLTLRTHKGEEVPYPQPQAKPTFNETTGEGISWAAWSWNPVTGCLHGCRYCYARAIIHRYPDANPAGFTPLFHDERLDAPGNTTIPAQYRDDGHESCGNGACKICAYRRVFVCSMADLYGRWVPDEWINQVHKAMLDSPRWEYLLLTKFPARYVGLELPPNAWVGTSVDEQKRVRIAEDAFRKIDGGKWKWLSLEPLTEPLEFDDLSMFDWVVIGAQTATVQPDGPVEAVKPHYDWVQRITEQARAADCKVHHKPNLTNGKPGMQMLNEYPEA